MDEERVAASGALAVRVAAQVIAYGGSVRFSNLRYLARHHGCTNRAVKSAVETLTGAELVEVDGDQVAALDLAELAAWVADELEFRSGVGVYTGRGN